MVILITIHMPQETPFNFGTCNVTLGLEAKSPQEAVEKLAATLGEEIDAGRRKQLVALVEAREKEASTNLGKGVALPHARTSLVNRLKIAVGVANEPFAWDASGAKVRLVFFMAVPKTAIEEYLQTMRRLMHVFKQPGAVERLCAAKDKDAFLVALEGEIAAANRDKA